MHRQAGHVLNPRMRHATLLVHFVAGTLLWMLAADTYPDYDGYSIYTTKGAVAAPQPKWPHLSAKLLAEVRPSRAQVKWMRAIVRVVPADAICRCDCRFWRYHCCSC